MSNGELLFIGYYIALVLLLSFYFLGMGYFFQKYLKGRKGEEVEEDNYKIFLYSIILLMLGLGRLFSAWFDINAGFQPIQDSLEYIHLWKIGVSL